MSEILLYDPVKKFLESLGYHPKGEVGGCDVVALRDGKPQFVVICELKMQFSLELVLQGVDRAAACDEVWLAARMSPTARGRENDSRFRALCRRLGFGLLGVKGDTVEVLLSPMALLPRRDPKRRSKLIDEHTRRRGDPTRGGGSRQPIMTAYRQEALACANSMLAGPRRPRDLKPTMPNVAKILRRNVYGWFCKSERGIYDITPAGRQAVERWKIETEV